MSPWQQSTSKHIFEHSFGNNGILPLLCECKPYKLRNLNFQKIWGQNSLLSTWPFSQTCICSKINASGIAKNKANVRKLKALRLSRFPYGISLLTICWICSLWVAYCCFNETGSHFRLWCMVSVKCWHLLEWYQHWSPWEMIQKCKLLTCAPGKTSKGVLFEWMNGSEWVSEWVSECGRMGQWVVEWVSERESEWVSEWGREEGWVCAWVWVSEGGSEWIRVWVSEWASEWRVEAPLF